MAVHRIRTLSTKEWHVVSAREDDAAARPDEHASWL
jgi:hypothetical protein